MSAVSDAGDANVRDATALSDVPGVELRHLRCFTAVVEERSFTHAAGRLGIGQPALTRTVQSLEAALGARLLERTTRRVDPTPAGLRLYDELTGLLPRLDDALRAPCRESVLRLGFTWLLPAECARLVEEFKRATGAGVRLVRRDAATAGLDTGETDVAVLRGEPADPATGGGERSRVLYHEDRVAAVSRTSTLARRRVLDWSELAGLPLVVNTVSGTTRPDLWPEGARPRVACTAGNFDEWVESVAADHGVGVAPRSVAGRYTHPGVRFVRLKNAPPVPVRIAIPALGAHPLAERLLGLVGGEAGA
ncbi:LysR family transcriptional regulator [Streptomyces sp. H27-D2]|uniref:LysR family transcriptional regulator n=1 Tax=Streptomyces sp. H27-D2 TaxID=3046304 RepID=UPI002DBA2996|nr:LysR family transcriptional regulator [Streptomyces sp. H27-D2]MEC4015094.1 LysR family transcriptional regulator [Streptomyces sp. H27-D2]